MHISEWEKQAVVRLSHICLADDRKCYPLSSLIARALSMCVLSNESSKEDAGVHHLMACVHLLKISLVIRSVWDSINLNLLLQGGQYVQKWDGIKAFFKP